VEHETLEIDLSNKPPWFRKVNPAGLVPALEVQGRVVVESLDICRCGPGHRPRLRSRRLSLRAEPQVFRGWTTGSFVDDEFEGPSLMPEVGASA
jgi:hypothetical protein